MKGHDLIEFLGTAHRFSIDLFNVTLIKVSSGSFKLAVALASRIEIVVCKVLEVRRRDLNDNFTLESKQAKTLA